MVRLSRRLLLSFAAILPGLALPFRALAATGIGEAVKVSGSGKVVHDGKEAPLRTGTGLEEGDTVMTGKDTLALLMLNTDTRINMGPESQIMVVSYLADMGGTINVGGAIVFDRPEEKGPVDLTFVTDFGEIGVRGTRFFVGPSKGKYSVFVQRGKVTVSNAGVTRTLAGGDGVDLAAGVAPTEVAQWKKPRIAEAFALVGMNP